MTTKLKTATAEKILIIEDEGEMCLLLNILLTDDHVELEHVKTLSDATDYLDRNQPKLILLDNKLPDGYGIDYISYVRQRYPAIKIIMITGFDSSAKDVAMENGADAFLEKPFTRDQLTTVVKSMLSQSSVV
jgi:DNA-binding response OmpR family regulator